LLFNDEWRHKNKLFYQSLLTWKRTVLGFVRILVVDASSKRKKPNGGSLSIVTLNVSGVLKTSKRTFHFL
jgi:hypothetical protein